VPQPIDAEFRTALEAMPLIELTADTLPAMRGTLSELTVMTGPDDVERTEHVIDSETGVAVRVHRSRTATTDDALPCVYSIHGGGYVLGSYDMDDGRLGAWCNALGCVGVSVEYRLAPDHPYPVPLEDCYAGLRWVHRHATELGIDAGRVGVAGLSAGGGLAAALALLARDRGELPVACQLLDSPMLDDRQLTPSSRSEGLPIWSRESNAFGWRSYLGDLYGADDVPYCAAPARAPDLSRLPPAFVCVGTVDGFCDEDIDYAVRLNQAGVPAELHVYPGAPHGFGMFPDAAVARQCTREQVAWLRRRFGS